MGNNKNTPNVKLNHFDLPQEVDGSKEITPSSPHQFELHTTKGSSNIFFFPKMVLVNVRRCFPADVSVNVHFSDQFSHD